MNLYDPSRAVNFEPEAFIPLVDWSEEHRAEMDAKIAAPLKDIFTAEQHWRYKIRAFLRPEHDRALKILVAQFHRLQVTGRVNISALVEPTEAEKRTALARLKAEPDLYRLAHKIARIRSYCAFLDQLDERDGISSKPRVVSGNASPGIAHGGAGALGGMSFMPFGLR